MSTTLRAETRDNLTKSEVKAKRREGKVPAVVYGKKLAPTPLLIDQKELLALLRSNPHAVVDLDIEGGDKEPAMVTDVQRDSLTRELLHVDFHQINMDEPVRTTIALDFVGEPIGVKEGGMMQTILHEVEIRCLPQNIPAALHVDVSELKLGDTLLVSSIQPPAGIEIKTDPDQTVVTVLAPQKAATEEVADKESAGETVEAAATSAERRDGLSGRRLHAVCWIGRGSPAAQSG
ncbi:50S ribosomal protein L25 [Gordoniibacillus kamchatkensis]|uniref:50S ribosomal protein L25 n=1 Tax=Gordoniibacillus kamchatkensis TaxID=1590651 RepID=UPI0009E5FADF|nr:50S ribosomal protein L25 [Paenibacillus sp. VKM B-2647]